MARDGFEYVARVVKAERLNYSRLGNPRWKLTTDEGNVHLTQSNASVNYDVARWFVDRGNHLGRPVWLQCTPAGRVIGIKAVN